MRLLLVAALLLLALPARAESFVAEGYDPAALTPEMLAATEAIANALEGIAPEGWQPQGGVERYTTANMYNKIDGRSELFMSYGVKGMTWVGLARQDDADTTIEVYVYDQGSTLSAFGVYGVERWQEAEPVKVGTEGYRSNADLFFRKGHYYVTLLGSDDNDVVRAAQQAMAEKIAGRLADDPTPLWGEAALPKEKRVANSLKYFATDAMSLDFLKNTFVCEVEEGDAKITHFVARLKDETAAKEAFAAYEKYLSSYGGTASTVEADGGPLLLGELSGGYFDAVFAQGTDLAGVTAVKDREGAIAAAVQLRTHLQSKP